VNYLNSTSRRNFLFRRIHRHAPHRVYTDRLFTTATNTTSAYIVFTMYLYVTILAFLKMSLHNLIKHLTITSFLVFLLVYNDISNI